MVMGGIVPVVNIDGINAGDLVLDGSTLAKIFLGDIKTWDDPAIKKLNPNAKLPSTAVTVVHRSDGSGTTFNFAYYLAQVSPDWNSKVSYNTSANGRSGSAPKATRASPTMSAKSQARSVMSNMPRSAEQARLHQDAEQRRQGCFAHQRGVPSRCGKRRLELCTGLWRDLGESAGSYLLADDGCYFHPNSQAATGRRRGSLSAQILRLGLGKGWQDG
jgi:PBP superfamily domain